MKSIPSWSFSYNNDESIALVLKGEKTASTFLYEHHSSPPKQLLQVGNIGILLFDNDKKACKTKTKDVIITEFNKRTSEFANLEGLKDQNFEFYQKSYFDFFRTIDSNFQCNSKIIFIIFEVIEDLTKERLKTASLIAEANKDIFKETNHITEINAGFNNDLFDVCNKYIIKVCANVDLENRFQKEIEFYQKHSKSNHFPKLYRYDTSKSVVPFVYEIIEKIDGKTLFYYWYKMTENQREETIKQIVEISKEIHQKEDVYFNWCEYIKSDIYHCYEKTKEHFDEKEKNIFNSAFNLFDKYLADYSLICIHNDLHFDNIIVEKNEKKLYFIDFNDVMIAPIDYEFRIFFICLEMPWRWANGEMDPLQKKEDYQNIIKFLLKYYDELNKIEHLEERFIIYAIQNEIYLMSKHNNISLKKTIIFYSKKLIELSK